MEHTEYVLASEISEYIFCKRGWWLRRQGKLEVNAAMLAGTRNHDKLFFFVTHLKQFFLIAWVLIVLSISFLILAFFLGGIH